jgi:hypothetical protein
VKVAISLYCAEAVAVSVDVVVIGFATVTEMVAGVLTALDGSFAVKVNASAPV